MLAELKNYTLDELYEVEANIDADSEPELMQHVLDEIQLRLVTPAESDDLLHVEDDLMSLTLRLLPESHYHLSLGFSTNFLVGGHKSVVQFTLSAAQLNTFISAVVEGKKASIGQSGFFSANKLLFSEQTAEQIQANRGRELTIYRRWLVLGFSVAPSVLTTPIVEGIKSLTSKLRL